MGSNPCGGRMFQERSKNHHNCSDYHGRRRNYYGRNDSFESKDFRHACTMCPGDFSHTSCKYCLNEDVFAGAENAKEDYTSYHDHESRRHCYNNGCNVCYDSFYEDPPSAFPNYRNFKRNYAANLEDGCEYCLKNGETAVIYSSHRFRNPSGTIACPLLKEYFCATSYDPSDDEYRFNKRCYEPCSINDAYLDMPLHRSKRCDKPQRRKVACRCCMESDEVPSGGICPKPYDHVGFDYFEKGPLERASAVPLVRRLSNGFLTRQDYFDLLNLT